MSDLTALELAWCDWMEKRGFRTIDRQDEGVSQTSFIAGGRAERTRIRHALLESSHLAFGDGHETKHLVAALDRIAPASEGKEE